MKRFTALFLLAVVLICVTFVSADILISSYEVDSSRMYRVEANRIAIEIEENGYKNLDLSKYKTIKSVVDDGGKDFYNSEYDYLIKEIDGRLYRFDYLAEYDSGDTVLVMNISLAAMSVLVIAVFVYIRQSIIKPFNKISNLPYELSKGYLTQPIKEQNGKYFGKFIWGIDLLRERLEENKAKELKLQKEKQTLLLSLSHDIKTPLGVIELYAKALEKKLYNDEEKQKQISASIIDKCNEIKNYVSDITSALNDDFLNFEVNTDVVYLSKVIDNIHSFYTEKMELLKIDFSIDEYADCLITTDVDRAVEVLQNIIENAVKYGDGKNIEITFAQEEDCILVTVANSGCELSESELPHIFDSFWRGSNTGSNSGSGLGLYICRKLMQEMNGEVFANIKDSTMYVTTVLPMA